MLYRRLCVGRSEFEEIPNLPRFGERLQDVGLYRRDPPLSHAVPRKGPWCQNYATPFDLETVSPAGQVVSPSETESDPSDDEASCSASSVRLIELMQ
jgi:hypothetical protein